MRTLSEVIALFDVNGIDPSAPGFLDQPAFLSAEQRNADFIENYGIYIKEQPYTKHYLDMARSRIQSCSDFLSRRLIQDGQTRQCANISTTLSKFLERLGIWNFVLKGGLTLTFRESLNLDRVAFAPINSTPDAAGHVWVVAPPFVIVDLTARQQRYRNGEERYLPQIVITENADRVQPEVYDWIDEDIIERVAQRTHRIPNMQYVNTHYRDAVARSEYFGTLEIMSEDVTMRYLGCAVSAIDGQLEDMKNLCLSGDYPIDLFTQFCEEQSIDVS